jgi:hypothetical protein
MDFRSKITPLAMNHTDTNRIELRNREEKRMDGKRNKPWFCAADLSPSEIANRRRFGLSGCVRAERRGSRVCLTVGNRPGYRGNRPYRPGPVTVPAGYQPLGLKNFEFEFQKLKIAEKISKNTP